MREYEVFKTATVVNPEKNRKNFQLTHYACCNGDHHRSTTYIEFLTNGEVDGIEVYSVGKRKPCDRTCHNKQGFFIDFDF